MYSRLLKPLLFQLDAETSHDATMAGLAMLSKSRLCCRLLEWFHSDRIRHQPIDVMGITFPNPLGLAAGLDKQANACNALHALGFGWLELGTVTPRPQPGNRKPRLFRLEHHQAIINRLGFNSIGLDRFVLNLRTANPDIVKGINIGKNATTPMAQAIDDYLTGLRAVADYADYVTINISSPNTPHLRDFQHQERLEPLLRALDRERRRLSDQLGKPIPLVLKISPDLALSAIQEIASLLRRHAIDGVAATNTTLSRSPIPDSPHQSERGGLSGPPIHQQSLEVIAALHQNLQGEVPIIGIGGIDSPRSALNALQAGASLIQIYSGLIYHGPALIFAILRGLTDPGADDSI